MKKFKELVEGLSHKVPVYHADRKTLVGHVSSGATSVGAAKLAKKKSAIFSRVNGEYSWVASGDLKELTAHLNESKYGDAMSSRLPGHLDDPRVEKPKKPVKPVKTTKESVYESYRDRALEEARLHHVLKGHPYHHKTDAELHYIIKDAFEAEKAIGTHDKKAMWKYGDQQNDAASILGYRKRGGKQIPEPKRVYTEMTEREQASHKDRIGSTLDANHATKLDKVKKKEVSTWAPSWGQKDYDKASKHFQQNLQARSLKEDAPHPGHVMNFSDRMEHQFFGGEEARKDRDAYAKHLKSLGKKVKLGSLRNQILHGSYGHVYSVTHKGTMEESVGTVPNVAFNESLKSVAAKHGYKFSHTQNSGAKVYAHPMGHMLVDDPNDKHWHHYHKAQAYTTGDRAIVGQGTTALVTHLTHFHGKGRTPLAEENSSYKIGDRVVPKIGPHKGEMHRVIHVHPTGHLNITPENSGHGRKNRYHLGAAKAHPDDVTRAEKLEETHKQEHTPEKSLRVIEKGLRQLSGHPVKVDMGKGKSVPMAMKGLESKNYQNLAENPIVREAFEAAKAKKKGDNGTKVKPNDFQEPKDLKSPGQQDPQQADIQAKPAPFGGQQPQGAPEKQSNAPKPEKKSDKLTVKGPGPEDQFQKEPTVAGLTTLVKA